MSSEDSLSRRGSVMWEEVGKDYYTVQVFEKSYRIEVNWEFQVQVLFMQQKYTAYLHCAGLCNEC